MFSKLAVLASLAIFAVATPTPGGGGSSGPANLCCQQTQTAGSPAGAALLASLGVIVQDVNALVGSDCSPLTVIGVSGTSCTSQAVNCDQVYDDSVVGVNCSPINVNA